ncbi:MAG: dihydroorotate dehydrogenase (quinone) [Xanthobacteraceae bacterium]
MIGLFDRLARPLLHALDPEDAHGLVIRMLKFAPLPRAARDDARLATRVFGLNFPNPIGIAAGFDKNAEVPDALLRLGFGFVEVGTVTPLPQPGNPRPRLFRLDADQGVINRLGFNSQGSDAVLARLAARAAPSLPSPASGGGFFNFSSPASGGGFFNFSSPASGGGWGGGIVGVNVGANKDAPDRIVDYVRLIERFAPVASYVAVNISSPNTPGLRNMQQAALLDDLLARVVDARERVAQKAGPTPVLLKIAPDLSLSDLDDVVGIARSRRVNGMIVGNTTVARPASLRAPATAKEAGGLSGRPLLPLANRMLAETYVRVEGVFPLIGAGGIDSGKTALAKIRAGASLVQVYSGLVFRGLGLIAEIKTTLLAALERDRQDSLIEYIGADAASVTAEPWPG